MPEPLSEVLPLDSPWEKVEPVHNFLVGSLPLFLLDQKLQAAARDQLISNSRVEIGQNIETINDFQSKTSASTEYPIPLDEYAHGYQNILPSDSRWTRVTAWIDDRPGHNGQILGMGEIQDQPNTIKNFQNHNQAKRAELIFSGGQVVAAKIDAPPLSAAEIVLEETCIRYNQNQYLQTGDLTIRPKVMNFDYPNQPYDKSINLELADDETTQDLHRAQTGDEIRVFVTNDNGQIEEVLIDTIKGPQNHLPLQGYLQKEALGLPDGSLVKLYGSRLSPLSKVQKPSKLQSGWYLYVKSPDPKNPLQWIDIDLKIIVSSEINKPHPV